MKAFVNQKPKTEVALLREDVARELLAPEAIARFAARNPDAVAVQGAGGVLRYAALERRALALSDRLRARGVGRGALVAVCLPTPRARSRSDSASARLSSAA